MESTIIKLIFSIFGNVFDPVSFTNLVGIIPTNYWIKGEAVLKGKEAIRRESSWEYKISETTLSFEDVSNKLDTIFRSKLEVIDQYRKENSLLVKLDIVLEILDGRTPAVYMDRNFLNFTNKLEAELDIDIYII